jgi:hypothetical protein
VAAFFGRDLTRQEARRWWTARDDTGALEWLGDAGSLRFEAAATPQHNVGRDWLHIETGLGEEPFDLTFEVRLDKVMGPGVFYCGLAVGMAESPPGRMEADDVTAVVALHLDKVYAGVHRGEVYALDARYGNLASRGITRPAEDGTYRPEHNWSREARALFSTDRPLRLRMRREGPDRIAFAAWRPGVGQTPAAPWWRGICTIPQKYAGRPLEHLIVKRIPISGVHLGQQAVGYGEILGMAGRLTELVLRQAPPVVDAVTWDPAALTPGDSFVIRGRGFPQEPMVRVAGTDAEVVARAEDRLEVRLPELEPGRRYAVTVSGPDGVDANEVDAVAVGRFLEEMSLLQAPPAGGRVATLQGAGFTEGTEVRVGGAKAEVVEVVSREAIRVRIPAGKPGRATVSARDGRDAFAGELAFAYASHPRLRFSREELAALKEKVKSPVFAPYLQRLEAIAAATLEKTPRGGRRAGGFVEAVAWHYALTGDEADRDWLRKALPAIAQTRPLGGWSGDTVSGVAFGYDLVAAELDAEAAGAVQQYLRAAVDHFRDASARNEWFHTNISSTNPLSNAAGISAVLVLGDVLADRDELLGAAKDHLLRYIRGSFGPDGGAIEGMGRGMEGLTDYLHAAHLLARHTGDRTLIDHPRVDAVADLFRTVVAAKDGILRFRKVYGGLQGLAPLADQERRTGDPLFRTLADAAAKDAGGSRATALGLAMMWRSTEAAPADPPAIPALSVLDRIEWASVRSRPRLDAGLFLGLKGGDGPQPYHQQHDVGSFTLFAGGEELLLDPGWGQTRGDQHNALVVDGTGPDVAGGTITDAWEGEDLRAVVLDATAAYRPWGIRRVRRSFVMAGDDAVVVLDDVLPSTDGAGRVETFFQTAEAKRPDDGDALVVEGEAGTLRIELHGAPGMPLEWSKEERKQRHRKSTWLTHAAGYTADPAAPLVTLVRYIRDGADRTPDAAGVVRDDDQTVVTLGAREVVFRRTATGWAFLPPAGEGEARTPLLTPAPDRTPPQATAVRADTPPRIDGDLDDAVWQRAESIGPLAPEEAWDFERESAHPTETRFAWDDEALYVALRCFEPDLASLEGGIEGPAQPVSGEDRIYLYLDPGRQREGNNFFGATILASGLDLGIYGKQGDIGLPLRHLHVGRELEAPTAWTVEIAIPWADLFHDPWETLPRLQPEPGLRVGLNVLRHYTARPAEVSVWARSYPWAVAAPHRWGTLVLE